MNNFENGPQEEEESKSFKASFEIIHDHPEYSTIQFCFWNNFKKLLWYETLIEKQVNATLSSLNCRLGNFYCLC